METPKMNYETSIKDVKQSKFNMSCQNLDTANLFEQKVKKVFEVLPNDLWECGHNQLTKVVPLSAPANTALTQNTYAIFNSNQSVWSHWNDFITNGTCFNDTYGNNVTNQNLNNLWKIPSVQANDLQLISKIANGWALPIYRPFNDLLLSTLGAIFDNTASASAIKFKIVSDVNKSALYETLFRVGLLNFINKYESGAVTSAGVGSIYEVAKIFMDEVPYVRATFTTGTDSGYKWIKKINVVEFGCSPYTVAKLYAAATSNRVNVDYDFSKSQYNYQPIAFRFFCNPYTSDVNYINSPFRLERVSINNEVNTYIYKKNVTDNLTDNVDVKIGEKFATALRYKYSDFFTDVVINHDCDSADGVQNEIFINGLQFTRTFIEPLIESLGGVFGLEKDKLTSLYYDRCNESDASLFDLYNRNFPSFIEVSSVNYTGKGFFVNPSQRFDVIGSSSEKSDIIEFCDVVINVYGNNFTNAFPVYCCPPVPCIPLTTDSFSLGYDSFGFLIYLCKSAFRNIDAFGLPIDALTVRPFIPYMEEKFNMLPFFCYSKAWNDVFRNKTVSSPELCYCETNGIALENQNRIDYIKVFNADYESVKNGWCIPFNPPTRNSLSLESVTAGRAVVDLIQSNNHYFNIMNYLDLFSLLTGYGLNISVINSIITSAHLDENDAFDIYGILVDKFYLPSYYNGLLHMRYQNFKKDYFSSALLDPSSGANNEMLPDNVVDLRAAQHRQSFWDSSAMTRSIKQWWLKNFGCTPSHGDDTRTMYLNSAHNPINIGEIVQTSQTDLTPQGTRTGLASGHGKDALFKKRFNEHGYIIIIQSITLDLQYYQGIEQIWIPKDSFLDYPLDEFKGLGNESILQKELNYNTEPESYEPQFIVGLSQRNSKVKYDGTNNPQMILRKSYAKYTVPNVALNSGQKLNDVFGYVPRWTNYKFAFDSLHGEMRTNLMFWNTFRKFFSQPILCHEFVNGECLADSDEFNRIFATMDDNLNDKFYINMFINASVLRSMPAVNRPYNY